jgi:hypothetical protein
MDDRLDIAFARWAQCNEELGRMVVVDRATLNALTPNGARGPLQRFAFGLWVELVMAIVPVVWLGNFAADSVHRPIEFVSAVVLDILAILVLVNVALQLVTLASIRYDAAITEVQSKVERLRILRLRSARGIFTLAVFAWLPLCIVGLSALFGSDVVSMLDVRWVIANVITGLAFVPFAIWLCRVVETRDRLSPIARVVARTISGSSLNAAFATLERVESFTREAS